MQPLFHPRLVNDPLADPGLFIAFQFERRAMMFDLGDLTPLSSRDILRIRDIFISHGHIDHIYGFDRWLRTCVGREATIRIFGPPHTIDRIEHKLQGYTWNLAPTFAAELTLRVGEFAADGGGRIAEFRLRERFRRRDLGNFSVPQGILVDEETFRVRAVELDHGIPCLAFALEEKAHVNVMKSALEAGGYRVGPWLRELRLAVLRGDPPERPIMARRQVGERTVAVECPLGALRDTVLTVERGQRIVYVVDAAGHAANVARIVDFARDADVLFIETPFLAEDRALADAKKHLTAAAAGEMARMAGVRRLEPFHFSSRYAAEAGRLREEALRAFAGESGPAHPSAWHCA